jgi:hypothetical protein
MGAFPGVPGAAADRTTIERQLFWGGRPALDTVLWINAIILSSTVDSGASPTTILRPGLIMGKITASGKYTVWDITATDGSEIAVALLARELKMTDDDGTAVDHALELAASGPVVNRELIGLTQMARAHMHPRFIFDDDLHGNRNPWINTVAKTADYTVVFGDNNKLFTNQGATGIVIFTLPTLTGARGTRFRFFAEADFDLRVSSVVADTMVAFNDAAADSVYFSETNSEVIGGGFEIVPNADETKWLVMPIFGFEDQTLTIVT